MKKTVFCAIALTTLLFLVTATRRAILAQTGKTGRSTIAQSLDPPAIPLSRLQESFIEFPLPKGEEAYASIDGKKMFQSVVELAQISRRYRDSGHPKFWGRIIGTTSDRETEEWLAAKFRTLGLSDVRIQPLDLPPQWM